MNVDNCELYLTRDCQRAIIKDSKNTKITVVELSTAKKLLQLQYLYQRSFVRQSKVFVFDSDGVLKVINCENSKEINFKIQDRQFKEIYGQIVDVYNFNDGAVGIKRSLSSQLKNSGGNPHHKLEFYSLSQNNDGNSSPMLSNFSELFEMLQHENFTLQVSNLTVLIHSHKYIFIVTYSYSKSQIQFNIVQQLKTKTFYVQPTLDKNFLHINLKADLSVHLFFHVKTHQFSQMVTSSEDAPTRSIQQQTIMNMRTYTHIEVIRSQPIQKIVSRSFRGIQDEFVVLSANIGSGNFLVKSSTS